MGIRSNLCFETLQLCHPWFLEKIRSYYLGSALIGTIFIWWDFPHYAVGCIIGWALIKWLIKERDRVKWVTRLPGQ